MKYTKKKRLSAVMLSCAMIPAAFGTLSPGTASAADANYGEALAMSLYFFDSNACGSGITGGPLTWRGDCHTYDGQAPVGSLSGEAKQAVDPDGDGKVDLDGGYHDAGDHVKFNLTIGFSMSSLAMSEYLNPGVYQKAGCIGHLMYVLRRGADYMMKSTFRSGSGEVVAVAGTVGDGNVDHGIFPPPEVQTYQRDVFWLTAGDNNSAVCCEMAAGLAGTAYIMKSADPSYAAKCVDYAKALLAFGTDHVGNNTAGMSFYSTDAMYQDEESVARAWLYILGEGDKPDRTPNNGDYGGIGDWDKYQWDKVWQGYSALMYKKTGDSVFLNELRFEADRHGLSASSFKGDAGWGNSRYNCAMQMTALSIAGDDKESPYALAAKYQMNFILGDNSDGYSYLIGYGTKWPTHIHHRAAQHLSEGQSLANNPEVKYTNYGTLVGGANNDGYQDHSDKYQYTEPALDYNGCFALACAGLYRLYGGDASAWDPIAKSASEINDSFDFGGGSISIETEPPVVTTTTETTTTVSDTTTSPAQKGLPGDVDCNGEVNIADAILLARFNAEDTDIFVTTQGKINAEVDGKAGIDAMDLTVILEYLAGIRTTL